MVGEGATGVLGGPGGNPPEPGTTRGIQPGGFSPQAVAVLDGMSPESRGVLERELAQKEGFVASERHRYSKAIQMGGVFQDMLKDPQFQRYIEAREARTTPKFFRSELKIPESGVLTVPAGDQEAVTSTGADGEQAPTQPEGRSVSSAQDLALLNQRLDGLDSRVGVHDERAGDAMVADFAAAHTDWPEHQVGMAAAKLSLKGQGSLEDWYTLAKAKAQATPANVVTTEGGTPQPAPKTTPAPLPVTVPETPPETSKRARTVEEAFNMAKAELEIHGEVQIAYEP